MELKTKEESKDCGISIDFIYEQLSEDMFLEWNTQHQKIFKYILKHLNLASTEYSNIIELDNRDVAKEMGWDYTEENGQEITEKIEKLTDFMRKNGEAELAKIYNSRWFCGHLVTVGGGDNDCTYISINPFLMKLAEVHIDSEIITEAK